MPGKQRGIIDVLKSMGTSTMISDVPSYGNTIFYSFGFLMLTCFVVLILTGIALVFLGPAWWDTTVFGVFTRSVHSWAAQAFVFFLFLHAFVVFSTSAFKKRRKFVWMLGTLLLFLVVIEAEFGYGLRTDFISQWRSLSGADFWNGSGLGFYINPLNYLQMFSIHTLIFPLLILALVTLHYFTVKKLGIAKPYRTDIDYKMVKADHWALFRRGIALVVVICLMAILFPYPFVPQVTIQHVALSEPSLVATTLLQELNSTSNTATYVDNIAPYTFNTSRVFVLTPYDAYARIHAGNNSAKLFANESASLKVQEIANAFSYFSNNGTIKDGLNYSNHAVSMVSALVLMAQTGIYEPLLQNAAPGNSNETLVLRFLSDTGYLGDKAEGMGIGLGQYGMIKDGNGIFPPNSWWLLPINLLDNTILANSANQDMYGAEALAITLLLMLAFPFMPYVNQIPDKLGLYKLFWKTKK